MSDREVPVTLVTISIAHVEGGRWRSCTGCHELDEGHPTGPWSLAFQCNLGLGCHECGGIGAVWEQLAVPVGSPVAAARQVCRGNVHVFVGGYGALCQCQRTAVRR